MYSSSRYRLFLLPVSPSSVTPFLVLFPTSHRHTILNSTGFPPYLSFLLFLPPSSHLSHHSLNLGPYPNLIQFPASNLDHSIEPRHLGRPFQAQSIIPSLFFLTLTTPSLIPSLAIQFPDARVHDHAIPSSPIITIRAELSPLLSSILYRQYSISLSLSSHFPTSYPCPTSHHCQPCYPNNGHAFPPVYRP